MSLGNGQRRTLTATRKTDPEAVPQDLGRRSGANEELKVAGIEEKHVGKAMIEFLTLSIASSTPANIET